MPVTTPKMTMIVVLLSLLLRIVKQLALSFLCFLHFGLCNEMVVAFRQVAENSTFMVMVICIVFSVIGIVENIVGPTMWVVSYSVSLALYSTLVLYSTSVGLTHSQLPLQLEVQEATMLLSTSATVRL